MFTLSSSGCGPSELSPVGRRTVFKVFRRRMECSDSVNRANITLHLSCRQSCTRGSGLKAMVVSYPHTVTSKPQDGPCAKTTPGKNVSSQDFGPFFGSPLKEDKFAGEVGRGAYSRTQLLLRHAPEVLLFFL